MSELHYELNEENWVILRKGEGGPELDRWPCCEHCLMTLGRDIDLPDAGRAEIKAMWYDEEGESDTRSWEVCGDCFEVGNPSGPGYRLAHLHESN